MSNTGDLRSVGGGQDPNLGSVGLPRPTQRHGPFRQSCNYCHETKRKCDKKLPSCSRCVNIGRACVYNAAEKNAEETQTEGAFQRRNEKKDIKEDSKSVGELAQSAKPVLSSVVSLENFEYMFERYKKCCDAFIYRCVDPPVLYGLYELWVQCATSNPDDLQLIANTMAEKEALKNSFCAVTAFCVGLANGYCSPENVSLLKHLLFTGVKIGSRVYESLEPNDAQGWSRAGAALCGLLLSALNMKMTSIYESEEVKLMFRTMRDNVERLHTKVDSMAPLLIASCYPLGEWYDFGARFLEWMANIRQEAIRSCNIYTSSAQRIHGAASSVWGGEMLVAAMLGEICAEYDLVNVVGPTSMEEPSPLLFNHYMTACPDIKAIIHLCGNASCWNQLSDGALTRGMSMSLLHFHLSWAYLRLKQPLDAVCQAMLGFQLWFQFMAQPGAPTCNHHSINEFLWGLRVLHDCHPMELLNLSQANNILKIDNPQELTPRGQNCLKVMRALVGSAAGIIAGGESTIHFDVLGTNAQNNQQQNINQNAFSKKAGMYTQQGGSEPTLW